MSWILLVDDEPHVTRLLSTRLERCGFSVEVAHNGVDALERMESRHFDVLVTDAVMPRMGGRDLCDEIRKRSRNQEPFIVMVTSSVDPDLHEWARQVENFEFMEKPVSIGRLVERITQAIEARDPAEQ